MWAISNCCEPQYLHQNLPIGLLFMVPEPLDCNTYSHEQLAGIKQRPKEVMKSRHLPTSSTPCDPTPICTVKTSSSLFLTSPSHDNMMLVDTKRKLLPAQRNVQGSAAELEQIWACLYSFPFNSDLSCQLDKVSEKRTTQEDVNHTKNTTLFRTISCTPWFLHASCCSRLLHTQKREFSPSHATSMSRTTPNRRAHPLHF